MSKRIARPLSLGVWDTRPIMYVEWIALANAHPDQDRVWRSHEYWARVHVRDDDPAFRDLGGES